MPRWVTLFIILQLWIVYSYGSIAKLYPDWLDATVPQILMRGRRDYYIVGPILQERWTHWVISYVGILFDGLIIPALLWKKTRKWAFFVSIFFHLFNSIVFQIGIFPYMSLAFTVFFYEPKIIYNLFLKRWKTYYEGSKEAVTNIIVPSYKTAMLSVFGLYFIVQIGLPLRQHFIEDNVLWTEEGHRLSWRMMLRSKGGTVSFTLEDKATGKKRSLDYKKYLTKKQQRNIKTKPDVIWQFAQHVKREQAALGKDVAIYVRCKVRVNGRKSKLLIDKEVDLASVSWEWFTHNEWVLDSDGYLDEKSPSVAKYAKQKELKEKREQKKDKEKE